MRTTSSRIVELDGVRAISIVFVLLVHISYGRLSGGFLGVDIFFVLSGYLITMLLLRELEEYDSINLKNFYVRRALRILPPLAFALMLGLFLAPSGSVEAMHKLRVMVSVLLFHSNFMPAEFMGNMVHTWSLAIEEQFYIIWPALLLVSRRMHKTAPVVVACLTILMCILVRLYMTIHMVDGDAIYTHTFARLDSIMVGCLLALLERAPIRFLPSRDSQIYWYLAWFGSILLLAVLLAGTRDFMQSVPMAFTLFSLVAAVLILAYQNIEEKSSLMLALRNPFSQWLGQRSYGLYLYHFPIFAALETLRIPGDMHNFAAIAFLKIVLSLAFAEFAWRIVERPFLRFKAGFPAHPNAQ